MKLIIQIPCYNEEKTLPSTIHDLPDKIDGIDTIEYLIIDDGSSDKTIEVAQRNGVHHILKNGTNIGLAKTFMKGLQFCLEHGADIVVNTDGDNQYFGGDIPLLVEPIINNQADIVVGSRPISKHKEFSKFKKKLQYLGSYILRVISKTDIKDAVSGFRSFSKEACLELNIYSKFSYCTETLIQAGNSNLRVTSVDIRVNPKTRESRLFSNIFEHIYKSSVTMITMFILYRPGRFFLSIGNFFFSLSLIIGVRFLYLTYWIPVREEGRTYIPSLILLSLFSFLGIFSYSLAVIGELIKYLRILLEKINKNLKSLLYQK
ncbi:MAG: glycosyltransferase family 2 protein [Candidatus Cloacimonetes bacterium]|nr:glycosyltransferase family 2 protein [Candidatus Cloacimonadota bacterium]